MGDDGERRGDPSPLAISVVAAEIVALESDGRWGEVAVRAADAVTMYRRLVMEAPGEFEAGLAAMLATLSKASSKVGRPDEALMAANEAVVLRRSRAAAIGGVAEAELAGALDDLSVRLTSSSRTAEALALREEALRLHRRRLLEDTSTEAELALARSLAGLSMLLGQVGRSRAALEAIDEAIDLRRRALPADEDWSAEKLAGSLQIRAERLGELRRWEEAAAAAEEAVAIERQRTGGVLADGSRLWAVLTTQGSVLVGSERTAEALTVLEEAVTIARRRIGPSPDRRYAEVGTSLVYQGTALAAAGRSEEAAGSAAEALDFYRRLVATPGGREYERSLAWALLHRARFMAVLRRFRQALETVEEAVAILDRIAAVQPDTPEPLLVTAWALRSGLPADLDRRGQALDVAEGAARTALGWLEADPSGVATTGVGILWMYLHRCRPGGPRDERLVGQYVAALGEAAHSGHQDALETLVALSTDSAEKQNWTAQLLTLLEAAAAEGNTAAMVALARRVQADDPDRAVALDRQAADLGNIQAKGLLAYLLAGSDPLTAARMEDEAAAAGDPYAMFRKGCHLEATDPCAARAMFERAARKRSHQAEERLGDLAQAVGDTFWARYWYRRAAEAGSVRAMSALGAVIVPYDPDGGRPWLEHAAEAGECTAMKNLAMLLRNQDSEAAKQWLTRACGAGDTDACARLKKQLRPPKTFRSLMKRALLRPSRR